MFFQKPTGLFALLDEESHFPRATSDTLTAKLHSNLSKCTYYKAPRGNAPTFTLKHYAGEVEYTLDEFLEKNRDSYVNFFS
jgi:myosin-3